MVHIFHLLPLLIQGILALSSDYFPPPVDGITSIPSKQDAAVTLSFKKTEVCETSYSGYVHFPPSFNVGVQDSPAYPKNMFFWFFPARESPEDAPLSIWVGGGPGQSAIAGAMTENGPCYVSDDGNSTIKNPFSRNNRVNMLYVDQPIGAGYSYSTLLNITLDQLTGSVTPTDFSQGIPYTPNTTTLPGTVSNLDLALTANNSDIAAKTMWYVAQTWFDTFPIYQPENNKISLWTNSYGGYFGPAIFKFWESQNKKIEAGELDAASLQLDTLGIENGCIDAVSQARSWPDSAFNNTYDFPMINETVYDGLINLVTDPQEGCLALTENCRQAAIVGDPSFFANNQTVNDICALATQQCFPLLLIPGIYAGRDAFDIAQLGTQRFPGYQHVAFFNQRWAQEGLGVPLNYTDNANLTGTYFVALVYGDRDSRCNWIGAENVSLTVYYGSASKFREAGYANLQTNATYTGGVVRQYDGFSFSRVFNAGHSVSSFQPETSSEIFDRVMFRQDIATGLERAGFDKSTPHSNLTRRSTRLTRGRHSSGVARSQPNESHYQSKGPSSSWEFKNKLPESPPIVCNLWMAPATCAPNQLQALADGTALISNFIVTSPT